MREAFNRLKTWTLKTCAAALVALAWVSMAACQHELTPLTGTVRITGTPQVGEWLAANTAALGGSGAYSFQWMREDSPIPGAFGQTYAVQPDDVGAAISVAVTRARSLGSVSSEPTGPVPEGLAALRGTVVITGSPNAGQTLGVDTSLLLGSGELSHQWMRGNAPIAGATGPTYAAQLGDQGSTISVIVSRANNYGGVVSAAVGPIAPPLPPRLTGSVFITGTPRVGQTLTANTANLGGGGTIFYEWRVGGVIVGAGSSLLLADRDARHFVTVTVTREGNSGSVTSAAIGPVTGAAANIASITVTNIPSRYIGRWGFIELAMPGTSNVVAFSSAVMITGSTATFAMMHRAGQPFNASGTFEVFLGIDDVMGNIVADYIIWSRHVSAGNNNVPFFAFTRMFSHFGFSESQGSPERAQSEGSRSRR